MTEQSVSVQSIISSACWALGGILAVVNVFAGPRLGAIAFLFMCVAATMNVKAAVRKLGRSLTGAYKLGVQEGRNDANLRGV